MTRELRSGRGNAGTANGKMDEDTANPPMAGWTAAKILWIRENEPELFAKCRHIMLPKDYVRFILTGKYATDASDASGMQMLDVKKQMLVAGNS